MDMKGRRRHCALHRISRNDPSSIRSPDCKQFQRTTWRAGGSGVEGSRQSEQEAWHYWHCFFGVYLCCHTLLGVYRERRPAMTISSTSWCWCGGATSATSMSCAEIRLRLAEVKKLPEIKDLLKYR